MKFRLVGVYFLHVDRKADLKKLVAALRSFSNAPNKQRPEHGIEATCRLHVLVVHSP